MQLSKVLVPDWNYLYSLASHTYMLIQALRSKHDVVTLEHEGKEWRVNLKKMIQKPVNQPFMQHKRRHVRYLVQESI